MKAIVDRSSCVGHGMCQMYAPSVYALDEDEKSYVHAELATSELEAAAQLGAHSCPQSAIKITVKED